MQKEISDLETRKNVISTKVRSLVVSVHIYVLLRTLILNIDEDVDFK